MAPNVDVFSCEYNLHSTIYHYVDIHLSIQLIKSHNCFACNLHFLFQFTFFMVQAILAFSSESSIVSGWQRVNKVRLHWILMLSSLACALFGLLAIMRNKVCIIQLQLLNPLTQKKV